MYVLCFVVSYCVVFCCVVLCTKLCFVWIIKSFLCVTFTYNFGGDRSKALRDIMHARLCHMCSSLMYVSHTHILTGLLFLEVFWLCPVVPEMHSCIYVQHMYVRTGLLFSSLARSSLLPSCANFSSPSACLFAFAHKLVRVWVACTATCMRALQHKTQPGLSAYMRWFLLLRTHLDTHTHTCIYACSKQGDTLLPKCADLCCRVHMCVCVYVCMYGSIHAFMYAATEATTCCLDVLTYAVACVCVYVWAYMHLCMPQPRRQLAA